MSREVQRKYEETKQQRHLTINQNDKGHVWFDLERLIFKLSFVSNDLEKVVSGLLTSFFEAAKRV